MDDFSPNIQVQTEASLTIFLSTGHRSELERWQKVGAGSCEHHVIVLSLVSYVLPQWWVHHHKLGAHWNYLESLRNYSYPGPTSRDSHFIGLGWALGVPRWF